MTLYQGSHYRDKPLVGALSVPGDKSLSHRVALFSALAEGTSRVSGLLDSLDIRSTLGAISALGAKVDVCEDAVSDSGAAASASPKASPATSSSGRLSGTIKGWGLRGPASSMKALDCGNSGTTMRLLLGLLSGYLIDVEMRGDASLSRRPMGRVTRPLSQMGARFETTDAEASLPIIVHGSNELTAINYHSPVASSQVASAILLAGLNAQGTTSVSVPYRCRNHTELLLPAFGIAVDVTNNDLTMSIAGGQKAHAYDCVVPGDPSSAAFILAAAALTPGSKVTVNTISINPTRSGFISVMQRMGVDITVQQNEKNTLGAEPVGNVTVCYSPDLVATIIEPYEIPTLIDEIPVLALLAATAQGTTVFREAGELRVKESDRFAAIIEGLTALQRTAYATDDDLNIEGDGKITSSAHLETYNDHRLAMTWLVAARAFGLDLKIDGLESLRVSYPGFLDDLERLNAS